jgi:hypothetical protein
MAINFSCSCGEPISADDADAGLEVRCARCGNLAKVPGDATDPMLGYVAPATGGTMVTPRAVEMLRQTVPWVRIMAILMFIGSGLMLLAGAAMFPVGLAVRGGGGPPAFLGCIYIPFALLYIVPALFLWRYAAHAKAFAITRHEQSLEEALQAQKSFWKFVAITALVVIGLYILVILGVLLVAVLMHR